MSDTPQGPGWWQASDGKFYPPEQQTAATPPTPGGGFEPSSSASGASDTAGLVKSLYDFQFDHFVTPKLIRFFYAFFVIVLTIGAVLIFIGFLASGESEGIIAALIIVPLGYFLYLIFGRMYFELVAALFRIADDLRAIRRGKGY